MQIRSSRLSLAGLVLLPALFLIEQQPFEPGDIIANLIFIHCVIGTVSAEYAANKAGYLKLVHMVPNRCSG